MGILILGAALTLLGNGSAAVLAPVFLGDRGQVMDFSHALEAPSWRHGFGTDSLGRDLFCRMLVGARVSLGVGALAVAIAILVGLMLGAVAGYAGGLWDRVIMSLADIFLCFPTLFLILAVVAVVGPSVLNLMAVIGMTSWMGTARLVRAEVLTLKEREFVLASRAMGARGLWIIFKHLIPNALGPVIVNAVLAVPVALLVESGLSFLGIGVQPPTPSWGNILLDGKATLGVAWWLTAFPGLAIFLTAFSLNALGETLHSVHSSD
ncbi:MAG: ABC transporter permease [Candidatus Omnitrophica bacterium]|nr:ABC transporter permease [Candidatus Omnitrophota bacterium]